MLGSTDLSHYSLLRWLPSKAANGMRSIVGAAAPPATNPPQPSIDLGQLSCEEVLALADDAHSYERTRQLGFVRGVLLPVRNALGNAARVGALLEEGPGPYNTGMAQVGQELAMQPLSSVLGLGGLPALLASIQPPSRLGPGGGHTVVVVVVVVHSQRLQAHVLAASFLTLCCQQGWRSS